MFEPTAATEPTTTVPTPATWQVFKSHLQLWKLFGLLPPSNGSPWRTLYICYGVFLNLSVTLLFPLTLIVNCFLAKNLNDFCETLYITITDVVCNLKFLNIFFVRYQLLKVKPILAYLDKRAAAKAERLALLEGIDAARFIFVTFRLMFICALFTSQLVAYYSPKRNLMYPAWFPWDWQNSKRNYLYAHAYQTYGLFVQAMQDLTNDTYPQAYMVVLSAHIKALGMRISQLGVEYKTMQCNRTKDSLELLAEERQLFAELVRCIDDHKVILDLFGIMQKTISTACLMQFICTGLAQCTIGVYMLYVGMDYSKLLNIAVFFGAITVEIFILCYYGDLLNQENENLISAIYSCNWMDQSKRFKQALLLLLQRAQKIDVVMAGKLIPVRLPTFVVVMKTAYSLFTVLNNVN